MASELKNRVDDGIIAHEAMSRDLPDWLSSFENNTLDLDNEMSETTICNRRDWIRQKIHDLETLYGKVCILFRS